MKEENMIKNTQTTKLIKRQVMDELFTEYPETVGSDSGFDFLLYTDFEELEQKTINGGKLDEQYGFIICEKYEWDNLEDVKTTMEDMFSLFSEIKEI
jgi:RNA-splicing ligase RtcB